MVRYCVSGSRKCLSGRCSQSTCEPASAWHVVVLFVFHSTQKEVASLHFGRSISGRDAAPDWVGSSIWPPQLRGMDTLRRAVPLAISALYVDRLDVPSDGR
jgi:hypothetical protein